MTTYFEDRMHLSAHFRRRAPKALAQFERADEDIRGWAGYSERAATKFLQEYTREDMWLDQLEQLPSEEHVYHLVSLLRPTELRAVAAGVINDTSSSSSKRDLLEVIKGINSWVATSEELIESRRKKRFIIAARSRRQ